MSTLFTLLPSLLRPAAVTPRTSLRKARTRLSLETLEDRRLLSGFHGSGHGEVEPVEIEHTPLPVGTVVVTRPSDDLSKPIVTITIEDRGRHGEVEPGDTRGLGEVEPGDRQGNGNKPVKINVVHPAKPPKHRRHGRRRHGEHLGAHA